MPNIVNLYAEQDADMIGDDTQPTLTLNNSSTGADLRAGILEPRGEGLLVRRADVGAQSVGVLRLQGNSVASGAVLEFTNKSFISITSTVLTTVANTDYAIPVQVGLETRYIPVYKAAALIGGAAF